MALNSLLCADVPLSTYTLTQTPTFNKSFLSFCTYFFVVCSAVSLHTVNSASSRRSDMNGNSKSPAASQFASPLSTIMASPSPDKNTAHDDVDAAQVKVSDIIIIIIIITDCFSRHPGVLQTLKSPCIVAWAINFMPSTQLWVLLNTIKSAVAMRR